MSQTVEVAKAIENFCQMATAHKDTPHNLDPQFGYSYGFRSDKPGQKFTRIVQTIIRDGATTDQSVHAFVDNQTGDLFMAAGWKAPAKGIRGNIVTGFEDICDRFTWAGGYLYMDSIKAAAK